MRSCEVVYIILVCSGCVLSTLTNGEGGFTASAFPPGFIFGTGTSAYQSEGAWNEGGKGENIWDRAIHTENIVVDNSNADIATDSYHRYKEDIKLAKQTGFSMFRFSISWSRVLPNGTNDYINEEGLEYYKNVLNELARHNIEPLVTLYHYDLPQPLQDIGGWMNETMVYHFQNYARVIFETLGHEVKWWITFNEPLQFVEGYSTKGMPPRLGLNGVGDYIATHNLLKAHAKVYRMYEKEFKPIQKGKIGTTLYIDNCIPKTDSKEDFTAVERLMQFKVEWFTHPIHSKTGDYPPGMRNIVDRNSRLEGRNQSRLPYFTHEEIEEIKGRQEARNVDRSWWGCIRTTCMHHPDGVTAYTATITPLPPCPLQRFSFPTDVASVDAEESTSDYLSFNNYAASNLVTSGLDPSYDDPSLEKDCNTISSYNSTWHKTKCWWIAINMDGIRAVLTWITVKYGENLPILITESGYCGDDSINDIDRVHYFDGYLKKLLKAIVEDGVNVIGYLTWSLTDVFEWRSGHTVRFGLYHVNFSDPQLPRRKKLSADYWERFLNQ